MSLELKHLVWVTLLMIPSTVLIVLVLKSLVVLTCDEFGSSKTFRVRVLWVLVVTLTRLQLVLSLNTGNLFVAAKFSLTGATPKHKSDVDYYDPDLIN